MIPAPLSTQFCRHILGGFAGRYVVYAAMGERARRVAQAHEFHRALHRFNLLQQGRASLAARRRETA